MRARCFAFLRAFFFEDCAGATATALGTGALLATAATATDALEADLERVVDAARQTVRDAGLAPTAVDALYFTGGSTGLAVLTERLGAAFPAARAVRGDRFASVATGLGLHAARLFGPTSQPRPWPPSLSS